MAESGEGYVNVRMPICDFGIYNPEFHYHPFPHHLHEESTLPQQLFPLLKYFQNWLSGNDFDCPKNSPTLLCTVQVWRNVRSDCTDIGMDIGTDIGMDIELSADGKENKWSLSFEPGALSSSPHIRACMMLKVLKPCFQL